MTEPLYFGPPDRPLFGHLHPAPGAKLGLVIVAPFGYEAICAHRSLRAFAESAAGAGIATLRFDRDGTGDSFGDDRDPDRVPAWIRSIHAAIDLLRAKTGVQQVALLGIRLGALLAAAAADRPDVAALVLVAPVVSGRAHVRELKILQGALGLPEKPIDPDLQEALGFVLTSETRTALSKLDLTKLPSPPRTLVLDRDDLPTAEAYATKVSADYRKLPGYVDMVLDPHKAKIPTEMVKATVDWLCSLPSELPNLRTSELPNLRTSERPVLIDDVLFGILHTPTAPPTGRAILLLNAGAISHVGPNRLYVPLARRWAALGHTVLRLDNSGIGDSRTRPGEPDNVVYSSRALEDVSAAIAYLRGLPAIRDVRAVGLCSGAYHAFKAAAHGQPVDGVVAINPLTFFWHDGDDLDFPEYQVEQQAERYSRSVLDVSKWKKVLRGQVDLRRAARTVAKFTTSRVVNTARDLSRRAGFPWREDLGAELDTIAKRKIELRFVFASADPGLPLLRTQGGSAAKHVRIDLIEGPDHTFTPLWSHDALTQTLGKLLDR